MRIQPATSEDCRAVAEVHVLSWQKAYQHLLPAAFLASISVEQREVMWREAVEKGNPQVLVAHSHGQVVGFIAFGPSRDEGESQGRAEIWALYLSPSAWSQGTGRALWLTALKHILAEGYKAVSLWVVANNDRAIRFYSAAGFVPEPHSARAIVLSGLQIQEIRYVFAGGG